jgi:hypothetical protein
MAADVTECFVVMPFGTKPIPGSGGREYDFDKVYRVIMRPAIEAAGFVAHRADQTLSSGPIHTDMFRALRDRPLVLADLSLLNPNVFYEVGIRHVLARSGTVLMCGHLPGENLSLPFDIALSRVVAYEYDGTRLDWEVVESVRARLRTTLEAARNTIDSPLHSLLTDVWIDAATGARSPVNGHHKANQREFEEIVAAHWKRDARGRDRQQLEILLKTERYRSEAFAISAIGRYCLSLDRLPPIANQVADQLRLVEQYEVADKLYKKLLGAKALTARELANYASVHSEVEVTLEGTDSAIALADKAINLARRRPAGYTGNAEADQAYCMFFRAGLLEWRARKWGVPTNPSDTIGLFEEVIDKWQKAGPPADDVDDLARVHLKAMYLRRRTGGESALPDERRHGDAILALRGDTADKETRSWLAWYQAIVYADRGNTEAAQRVAYKQAAIDEDEPADIRGRRHSLLRRLINDNADVQRNSAAIVKLTQLLYS